MARASAKTTVGQRTDDPWARCLRSFVRALGVTQGIWSELVGRSRNQVYVNALDHDYRKSINDDMIEMSWQMEDTVDQIRAMPFDRLDRSWLRPRRMEVQVVHPITAAWLRSMLSMDEIYAKLICAEKSGMITRRKRYALMLPCQLAYMAFKATAMNIVFSSTDPILNETEAQTTMF